MMKLSPPTLFRALLASAAGVIVMSANHAAADSPVRVTDWVQAEGEVADWGAVVNRHLAELPEGAVVMFPGGREYVVTTEIHLHQGVHFQFGAGAAVRGEGVDALFVIRGGNAFSFAGLGGQAVLAVEDRPQAAVIDLSRGEPGIAPDLTVRDLRIEGYRGIIGLQQPNPEIPRSRYIEDAAGLGEFIVENCHFHASDLHIGHSQASIDRFRLENSRFTGNVRYAVFVASPIANGATVRGNHIHNAGIRGIQIGGGAATQIDDGAVNHVSSVIVHDNHIIGGGNRADQMTAYILGIIVYGNNISIQGNVVRDFNRGVPVPGARVGHHFPLADGTFNRSPWLPDASLARGFRRLAGAAIYAKGRYGMIANNVCTNSGWRSVIEVKTGGREPYFLVANNIVDGKSLAIEDSFGFEPNVARALWVNNVVSDMPYMAFKVSNRMESAYINNVIYDSKIGFRVSATEAANPELILNNYFVNVETPVAGLSNMRATARVAAPPMLVAESLLALPEANEANRGQMAFVRGDDADDLYIVRRTGDAYAWYAMALEPAPVSSTGMWGIQGDNLVLNPLQDRDAATGAEGDRWTQLGQYSQFPYGWQTSSSLDDTPAEAIFAYDTLASPSGSRVLKAGERGLPPHNWLLQQHLPLEAGKTYLARAVVKRSDRNNRLTLIVQNGEDRQSERSSQVGQWETLRVVFTVPEGGESLTRLRLYSTHSGEDSAVWIDEVTLHEIADR